MHPFDLQIEKEVKVMRIKSKSVLYFSIYLYLVSVFCFSTGTGIEHYFSIAAFAFMCGSFLIYGIVDPKRIRVSKPYFVFNCLFWLMNFFSIIWSSYRDVFYQSNLINDIIQILPLILIVTNLSTGKKEIETLMKIYLSAVFTMILVIVARTPLSDYLNGVRIGTVTGLWVTQLGRFYVFALIFLLYFAKECKKRKNRILCIFSMILVAVFLLLTQAKGAVISILLFLMISEILLEKDRKRAVRNLATLAALCIVVFLILLNSSYFMNNFFSRFLELFDFFSKSEDIVSATDMGSTATRFELMGFGFHLFAESPLIGQGYNAVYGYTDSIQYLISTYSHCNYTEILSSTGLIGLAIYLTPLLLNLKHLPERGKSSLIRMSLSITLLVLITDIYGITYSDVGTLFALSVSSGYLLQRRGKTNELCSRRCHVQQRNA